MSKKESFPFNGRDRAQYRAFRSSLKLVDLNAPVPGAANPLLPPLIVDGPRYLPYAYFNKSLDFLVPEFADHADPVPTLVTIRMSVDGTEDALTYKYEEVTPLDPPPPIPMTLHLIDKDKDGLRKISYTLDFGGNPATVNSLDYMVDKAPPTLDRTVELSQSVQDYGIGPENFTGGATVPLTYQNYTGKRLGDLLKCFIGPSRQVRREVGSVRVDASNKDTPIVFNLTAAHVDSYDGAYIVWVEGESYPGVPAVPSALTNVWVFKDARPVVADSLYVPQIVDADSDALEVQQFIDGVGAGLEKSYPNINTSLDKLVVSIDGVEQPEQSMIGFPSVHDLNSQALLAQGHGRRQVELGYKIKRGNVFFPKDWITRRVWLDVRKPAAPFDPLKPNPPDETLLQPWIQGPKSSVKNRLTAADKQDGGPVKGFLPFHPLFKFGDTAQFLFNGREVPPPGGIWKHPDDGSEDPLQPIPFNLTWAFLDNVGDDDTAQLQVLVTHDLNFNEAVSPQQTAYVRTTPTILIAAGFRHMNADDRIGFICSSLRRLVLPNNEVVGVVRIPGDTRLADREITLIYGGYPNANAVPSDLIAGSEFDVKFTPTLAQATNGFDMYVQYAPLLATRNAYGRVDYTVDIEGEFVSTKGVVVRVNMSRGSDTCDLPAVTDPA